MNEISLEEFRLQSESAGYRFVCPMCGNVATPQEFKAAGADPERAARECIGRTMDPMPKPKKGKKPCDWAAFGLFGNLGRGLLVKMPNGKTVQTFALDSH